MVFPFEYFKGDKANNNVEGLRENSKGTTLRNQKRVHVIQT